MKKVLSYYLLFLLSNYAAAQTGTTAYEFLNIPTSAHSAALGGNAVSMIEDDVTLMFENPALLSNVSNNSLNFDFMSYMSGSLKLSAAFSRQLGQRGNWSIGAQVLNYGKMTETNASFEELGTFNANDINIQGGYTYMFTDKLTGGVQGKVLMSNYGDYSSIGLAVDLGLNYYNAAKGLSVGLVAQNLGGQVDPLYEANQKIPFNLVLGISKMLPNAPIRINVDFSDLTHWKKSYFAVSGEELSSSKRFLNHLAIGAEVFPSKQTWVALGYNFRRAYEMKVLDSSHWAGFSIGAGLSVKKFKIGLAFAKYHQASSSLLINASYVL